MLNSVTKSDIIRPTHSPSSIDDLTLQLQELDLKIRIKKLSVHLLHKELELTQRSEYLKQELKKELTLKNATAGVQLIKEHPKTIFMFADMQDYTNLSKQLSTKKLVKLLDTIYSEFNQIVEKIGSPVGIEVVKITGDCIMLSASKHHTATLTEQARIMVNISQLFSENLKELNHKHDVTGGFPIVFRFGINIGPAAQVEISFKSDGKMIRLNDWLGESVNKAARMESSGIPDLTQITPEVYNLVHSVYECTPCEHVVKSYGIQPTYFILHPRQRKMSDPTPLSTLYRTKSAELIGQNKVKKLK